MVRIMGGAGRAGGGVGGGTGERGSPPPCWAGEEGEWTATAGSLPNDPRDLQDAALLGVTQIDRMVDGILRLGVVVQKGAVHPLFARPVGGGREDGEQAFDHGVDVEETPGLRAVAVHGERFAV